MKKISNAEIKKLWEYTEARLKKSDLPLKVELEKLRQENAVKKKQKQIDLWKKNNGNNFDIPKIQDTWKETALKSSEQFMDSVINALSVVEGISKTNDALKYNMNLQDAEIDMGEATKLADNIFKINIINSILKMNNLDDWIKKEIICRYISSIFPYKDGQPKAIQESMSSELLEELMRLKEPEILPDKLKGK